MRPEEPFEEMDRDSSDVQSAHGTINTLYSNGRSQVPMTLEGSAPIGLALTTGTTTSIDNEKRPAIFPSLAHEIAGVAVLTMAPALTSLNTGGLLIALPRIGQEFNVSGGTLSWTLSATSLATASVLLFMGQLADTVGRRRLVLASFAWFSLMSLGGGLVRNPTGFFILRAMQGVSGASSVPSAVGIIGAGYLPGKRKNRAMATFSSGAPLGFVGGVITGGICTEVLNWHAVLYFYAIIYGLVAVAGFFLLPKDPPLPWEDVKARLKTMDYGGIFLTIAGFTLFIFSLSQWNSAPGGWSNSYIIACLVIGVVMIFGFIAYEVYVPRRPLMPMYLWQSTQFCLTMAVGACGWMAYTGVLSYFATLYFQDLRHTSAILTTAYFVPQAIMGTLVNVFAGMFLHKISGKILLIAAMLGFFVASLLWSLIGLGTSYWALPFPAFLTVVIGLDLAYNVCNMHVLSLVDKTMQSTVAGIFNTVIQMASAIGLAVSTGIVAAVVPDNPTPKQTLHGYKSAFRFALAVSSLGLLLSLFIKIGTQGGKKKSKSSH